MYQKTKSLGSILRLSDNAFIPADPGNSDYAAFLKWEAEGNVIAEIPVSLDEAKAEKLAEINSKAAAVAASMTDGYPEFEMKTWPQQESESMAWGDDSTAATPMIDLMASTRGIDRLVFLQKTLDKVTLFRQFSAQLVGLRQKYEDQLNAATTAEEIAVIDPVYVIG